MKIFKIIICYILGEGGASDTILDSWDASQIVGVNKTQVKTFVNGLAKISFI